MSRSTPSGSGQFLMHSIPFSERDFCLGAKRGRRIQATKVHSEAGMGRARNAWVCSLRQLFSCFMDETNAPVRQVSYCSIFIIIG